MADNKATIVLDVNDAQLIAKSLQARKSLGGGAKEAAGHFDRMTGSLGRTLLGVGTLVNLIKGVANAVNQVSSAARDLNKTTGARGLSSEIAGQRLGLSATQTQAIVGGSSTRSEDEMAQFLSSLTGVKGPGGRKLSTRDVARATQLFGSGVIDQGEITGALTEGGSAGLNRLGNQVGGRLGGLSGDARTELELRRLENDEARRVSATNSDSGAARRLADARMARKRAENPWTYAAQDAIAQATSIVGGRELIDAGNAALGSGGASSDIAAIRANTAPRLNLTGNGP